MERLDPSRRSARPPNLLVAHAERNRTRFLALAVGLPLSVGSTATGVHFLNLAPLLFQFGCWNADIARFVCLLPHGTRRDCAISVG
jgi:hypothetical protein